MSYRLAVGLWYNCVVSKPSLARDGGQRATGVIDTLSAGYGVVNQQPWIILIPVLLDLFLWLGPQVSVSPIVGRLVTDWAPPGGVGEEQGLALEELRRSILNAADEFNVLSALSPSLVGVPSVAVLFGGRGAFQLVDSWGVALAAVALASLAGLGLGTAYYTVLAQQVCDGVVTPWRWLRAAWQAWRRVLGLVLLLAGLGLLLGLPTLAALAVAAAVSPELASFGVAALAVALVWAQFYLFFAPDAIFVSEIGPVLAVKRSVMLVRAYFWQSVLLVTLTWVILLGMSQVWLWLANNDVGALVSILGNAYIASGLVAASMIFYRERLGLLTRQQQPDAAA